MFLKFRTSVYDDLANTEHGHQRTVPTGASGASGGLPTVALTREMHCCATNGASGARGGTTTVAFTRECSSHGNMSLQSWQYFFAVMAASPCRHGSISCVAVAVSLPLQQRSFSRGAHFLHTWWRRATHLSVLAARGSCLFGSRANSNNISTDSSELVSGFLCASPGEIRKGNLIPA